VVAGQATDADLRAEPHDAPRIAAARMRFAHLDDVTEKDLERWLWHNRLDALSGKCFAKSARAGRIRPPINPAAL
jgi:hypothetical protein